MPTAEFALRRHADVLAIDGVLTRPVVASAWRDALPLLEGVRRIDLGAVSAIDSAGLAMLAALSRRAGHPAIDGMPPGYAELRSAYRLDATLACAAH